MRHERNRGQTPFFILLCLIIFHSLKKMGSVPYFPYDLQQVLFPSDTPVPWHIFLVSKLKVNAYHCSMTIQVLLLLVP